MVTDQDPIGDHTVPTGWGKIGDGRPQASYTGERFMRTFFDFTNEVTLLGSSPEDWKRGSGQLPLSISFLSQSFFSHCLEKHSFPRP